MPGLEPAAGVALEADAAASCTSSSSSWFWLTLHGGCRSKPLLPEATLQKGYTGAETNKSTDAARTLTHTESLVKLKKNDCSFYASNDRHSFYILSLVLLQLFSISFSRKSVLPKTTATLNVNVSPSSEKFPGEIQNIPEFPRMRCICSSSTCRTH